MGLHYAVGSGTGKWEVGSRTRSGRWEVGLHYAVGSWTGKWEVGSRTKKWEVGSGPADRGTNLCWRLAQFSAHHINPE